MSRLFYVMQAGIIPPHLDIKYKKYLNNENANKKCFHYL